MKNLIKIRARPKLNSPVMLAAWPGISNVSLIVATLALPVVYLQNWPL